MIALPYPPRRSHLRVFSAILGLVAGAALAIPLSLLTGPWFTLLLPIAFGLAMGLIGPLVSSEPWILLYRISNKLARMFSRGAWAWVSALTFLVVLASGRCRPAMALTAPGANGSWQPTPDRSRLRQAGAPLTGGISAVWHWVRQSGTWWAALMLPLFLLLSALETEKEADTLPANVYTLF